MKYITLFIFSFIFFLNISCTGYKEFVPSETVVNRISLRGNKQLASGDIKANIPSLKYSYKRILPSKFFLYLKNHRIRKDSTFNHKPFFSFFTNYNPVFTEDFITSSKSSLKKFYRKSGFLNADVIVIIDSSKINKKQVGIEFVVKEGNLSVFTKDDSILIDNPVLAKDTKEYLKTNSLIEKGQSLSFEIIKEEKEKLSNYFKNKGYYFFTPDAIGIQINDLKDSTLNTISLLYKIPDFKGPFVNRNFDRLFRFEKPVFLINKKAEITFEYVNSTLNNALLKLINIKEGDLYSVENLNQSMQNIYLTDQFKSVSVKFDTLKTKISPEFELITNDKYNFSSEFGGSIFRGIPGPFLANSFKIRRILNSLNYIDISNRIGFEAQTGFINTSETRRNLEFNLGASINFPRLYLPSSIKSKLGVIFAPQTQIGLSYDYIDRPEYIRTNVNLYNRLFWRKSPFQFFQLSFLDLNIINTNYPSTETSRSFQNYLDELRLQGNNLYRSFNPSFVSSINFQYSYRDFLPGNILINGKAFSFGVESGGTILNFIPSKRMDFIQNLIGSNQDLQFYRFLRFNADFRKYKLVGKFNKSQLAFRISTGVAYAYGQENNYQLPYEKNFFVGGPSSIRAWKPRRLGPGSYNPGNNLIEQPGSILLESSIEYRFPIIYFLGKLNGAFFIDAGNIWTFSNSQSNLNTNFKWNSFFNEIAVGTGFGLRWDFSFFLLRMDIASKVFNPAKPTNEKWVLNKTTLSVGENPLEFNIGIGYPF